MYVVGTGTNIFRGTFRLKAWIEKGTAPELKDLEPKDGGENNGEQ